MGKQGLGSSKSNTPKQTLIFLHLQKTGGQGLQNLPFSSLDSPQDSAETGSSKNMW